MSDSTSEWAHDRAPGGHQSMNGLERRKVLESTFTAMSEGVVVQAPSGEIVLCNPAAERILGLTADEMAGRTLMDARWQAAHEDGSPFPGDTHPTMVALRTGAPQRGVLMSVHRPDGDRVLISVNAEPIRDAAAADPVAVVATFADITQARESERRMHGLLTQVSDLFKHAPCGYHAIGPDGTFAEINDTELEWLGTTREEVIGKLRLTDFMTPEGVAALEGTFPRLVSGELPGFEVEVDLVGRHGQRRRVLARGSVQRDAQGRFARTRTILVDVTELRRAQWRLADAQRMESIGRLTGGIAHAFNNLLTVIVGTAELASETAPEQGSLRHDLETILEAARRASGLVGHLVTYARQQVTEPVAMQLPEAVDAIVGTARRSAPPDIRFQVTHHASVVVRIDAHALQQAVSALLENAVEASGAGAIAIDTGTREVTAVDVAAMPHMRPGTFAFIAVTDHGRGMAPEAQARAIEPFFTTKEFGRGAGLGLSIAHGVVAQAGGGLTLRSEIGQGTTVTLYMPLSGSRPDADVA